MSDETQAQDELKIPWEDQVINGGRADYYGNIYVRVLSEPWSSHAPHAGPRVRREGRGLQSYLIVSRCMKTTQATHSKSRVTEYLERLGASRASLKAAGYARDATVPLCAARIAGTTASKGSKGDVTYGLLQLPREVEPGVCLRPGTTHKHY